MYGFRMAQLAAPEYTLLQRLRNDVLGGCTQRVAIATALRVTAEVVREGGVRRVVEHHNEFRSAAPSERRDDLLPMETILAAAPSRSPEPPPPPVAEEATEVVNLTRKYLRRHKVKAEVEFSWGATEVKAPELVEIGIAHV